MVSCGGSAEGGVFLRWRRGGHVPGGGERSRCTCFPGGVLCTDRFRGCHVVRRVQTAVGVSVSSGMLDLKIDTGDIPPEELVELLHSYRQKKKYHRLKNGTFVRMEESSVGMLEEMAAALRLTPKEMIRGNMHLPVYRALYLDRLLEEHEDSLQ